MKNKKMIAMMLVILIMCTVWGGVVAAMAAVGSGNTTNGGFATTDGTYLYYSADNKLYQAELNGENPKVLIEGIRSFESLVIYGDWIYYQTSNFNGGNLNKVKKDGSNDTYLTSCSSSCNAVINGDDLYFLTRDNKIVKRNLPRWENEQEQTVGSTYSNFMIVGDHIYFDNNDASVGAVGLCRVDLNGNSFVSYGIGTISYLVGSSGGNLIYTADSQIKSIPLEGDSEQILLSGAGYYANVYDGYIYFRDNSHMLDRIPIDGGEVQTSSMRVYANICIVNDKIFSRNPDDFSDVLIADMPGFLFSNEENQEGNQENNNSGNEYHGEPSNSDSKFTKISDWAATEVAQAEENGLVPSYFYNKDLTAPITRDEFAAVSVQLYETLTNKTAASVSMPFRDIGTSSLKKEIGKAYGLNIAIGISNTEFAPRESIDREQLATMLCRVVKKYKFPEWNITVDDEYYMGGASAKKFADDAEISQWAKDSVYFMSSVGIIKGVGNNLFAPRKSSSAQTGLDIADATREQAIAMSNRIFLNRESY